MTGPPTLKTMAALIPGDLAAKRKELCDVWLNLDNAYHLAPAGLIKAAIHNIMTKVNAKIERIDRAMGK